jgi:SAM-dependent methyltransferase
VTLPRYLITERLKQRIPWFVKIPAKVVLSRLPLGLRSWQHLNLFRAGPMDFPAYALDTFEKHYRSVALTGLNGCNVLEIGPGNSLLTALFARSFGAAKTWLVDEETLASQDVGLFAQAELMLAERGLPVPGVTTAPSMDAVKERLNLQYLTSGLASLRTIPSATIDFLFSNAVLEHVRLADFAEIIKETRRVLKPRGVASHVIDFKDHLQGALNNLRFSERVWESQFMAGSGFYTNRLAWPKMENVFKEAGFAAQLSSFTNWPQGLPTAQSRMAIPFRNLPPSDFTVMEAHAVLRPVG